MKAYWFSRQDGTTEHLKTPAEIGRTDTVEGKIIPCQHGLHASPTPWDALKYACGPVLWEVAIDDDAIPHDGDKFASRTRTYLRCADLTKAMRAFAAAQALSVAHLWEMPAVVSEYLKAITAGEDREDLRAAASDAASDAWAAWTAWAVWAAWAASAASAASAARAARAAMAASAASAASAAALDAQAQFNHIAMEALR